MEQNVLHSKSSASSAGHKYLVLVVLVGGLEAEESGCAEQRTELYISSPGKQNPLEIDTYFQIYYEELAHMILEAEESHSLMVSFSLRQEKMRWDVLDKGVRL